ncbi:MAG TPA: hypothetical protein VFN49_00920 [Candidatus Aquilonibacter sp.]|nr:hypothetical protein [Candidatus Aquilonibacter sp.]
MADSGVVHAAAYGAGFAVCAALIAAFLIKGAYARQRVLRARSGVQIGGIYGEFGRVVYWEDDRLYVADWDVMDGFKVIPETVVRLKPVAGSVSDAEREAVLRALAQRRVSP